MALYTPKKVVLNWFRHDVSFTVDLMSSYVDGVEDQAVESVERYRDDAESHMVEEHAEEGYARIVDIYKGLDSETWDLDGIFTEHFPSLQRRSALLSIMGMFEYELDQLCRLYQSEKDFRLDLSDLTGKGIERAVSYLEKVARLDVYRQSKEWNHIKKIQKIRNIIVHQNGSIIDVNGNEIKAARDYINQIDSLYGDKEVILDEGFLSHVVEIFKEYFSLIAKSIESVENA